VFCYFNSDVYFNTINAYSQVVQKIKEQLCYVARDKDMERQLADETTVLVSKYTVCSMRRLPSILTCSCQMAV
jgi:hypothetical protein